MLENLQNSGISESWKSKSVKEDEEIMGTLVIINQEIFIIHL